jgi:Na+-translocating ferredoxin:NAD+ oxidoreductase RnfE subunit
MSNVKILMNGLIKENPTFVLLLGMCPTLATTTSAINGLSMGLATMAVLICTNFVISCINFLRYAQEWTDTEKLRQDDVVDEYRRDKYQ